MRQGPAWPALAFDWDGHKETRPQGFKDYPDCGPDFKPLDYDRNLVRYFEDSTALTRTLAGLGAGELDDGITPADDRRDAALRGRPDRLRPGRPQRPARRGRGLELGGRPAVRAVALRGAARRRRRAVRPVLHAPLRDEGRPLCRRGERWLIPAKRVDAQRALRECRRYKARSAVPRTGREAQLVRAKMAARRTGEVWLGYRLRDGGWNPLDPR